MNKDFDILAEQVAEYIGVVQPQLDRLQELEKTAKAELTAKANFVKRATEAVRSLSESGLVSANDINSIVDKVAGDPSAVWDLVEKVAASVGPDQLGARSNEKASAAPMDPWVREFGGYTNANTGMID